MLGRDSAGGGGGGVGVDVEIDRPLLPMETLIQLPAIAGADDSSTDAAMVRRASLRFMIISFLGVYIILTLRNQKGLHEVVNLFGFFCKVIFFIIA